jgi:hypothetical protein
VVSSVSNFGTNSAAIAACIAGIDRSLDHVVERGVERLRGIAVIDRAQHVAHGLHKRIVDW